MISLSQKFHVPKRKIWAMLKKEKKIHAKGHEKKWTSVQRIKQWVLRCLPRKREKREERNKIAHTFK
jgi:hypothetical protein